jgi:hypothetical protein
MDNGTRRRWTAEDKLKVPQEARQAGRKGSEVCRQPAMQPTEATMFALSPLGDAARLR